MSGLSKYLPNTPKLQNKDGDVELSTLAGKIVFFYFSASWCPSCRGFTPQLIEFYNKFAKEKNFEVILVTWDEEEAAHKEYFGKMPWLAIPFESKKDMDRLREGFNVQTIPSLAGVEADSGKVVTLAARNMVVKDPEAKDFPWRS